jgi:hypothetical protein
MKTVIIHHRRVTAPHDGWKMSYLADGEDTLVPVAGRDDFGPFYRVDIADDEDELQYRLWHGRANNPTLDPPGNEWQSVPVAASSTEIYYVEGDVSGGKIQPLPTTQIELRAYDRIIGEVGSIPKQLIALRDASTISVEQLGQTIGTSLTTAATTVEGALTAVRQVLDGQAGALQRVLSVQPPSVDEQATRDLATLVLGPATVLAAVLGQVATEFQAESGAPIPEPLDYLPVRGQEPQQSSSSAVLAGLIELGGVATSLRDRSDALAADPTGVDAAYLSQELTAAIDHIDQSVDELVKSMKELFPVVIPPAVQNLHDAIRDRLRPAVAQVKSAI